MPIMELFIETLTGTAFELRVSPFETIMSVKAKIQRLEGIPITQQHLIWQSSELEDDYCLHDYSIHDGATLKLVLQMRGGPINTRRIPVDDPALREMAEYMEANRDEIFEKLPSSNRQVTLLVFREGDQLNFFRVVDRGDGTLTPLSESLSGTSVYNLYDEDDDVDCQTKEKLEENDKLKEKMVSLRNKMETLTVHKKPKTTVISASDARPESRTRLRQIPSATALNLQPLNRNPCLPPVGSQLLPAKHLPDDSRSSVSPLSPLQKHSGSEDSPSPVEQSLTDFKSVDKNNSIDCSNLDQSSPIKKQSDSGSSKHNSKTGLDLKYGLYSVNEDTDNIDDAQPSSSSCGETLQHTGAAYSSANTNFRDEVVKHRHLPHPPSIKKPNNPKRDSKELKDLNTFPPASSRLNRIRESNQKERNKNDLSLDSFREALGRCSRLNDTKDFNYDSFQDFLHRSPPPSSKYPSAERKKEFTIESLSTSEARAMSGLLRQASIERLGSSCIGNYVTSASKPRYSRGTSSGLKESRMVTPDSRRVSAHLQRLSASRDGRIPSPSHRLPPVKAKKKSHKRCFMCTKKTGLATSYQCRCGNNFCAAHRYAEAHECTFDYKTEGRKLLEQANPVVSAPKLPKI